MACAGRSGGHIAHQTQNLGKTPAQRCSLLRAVFPGQIRQGRCRGQNAGKWQPQLGGGQRKSPELPEFRRALQHEKVQLPPALHLGTEDGAGKVQGQIQAAAFVGGVFLLPSGEQRRNFRAKGQRQVLCCRVALENAARFDTEAGGDDQIQRLYVQGFVVHDSPPDSGSLRRIGENFPGRFRQFFYGYFNAQISK